MSDPERMTSAETRHAARPAQQPDAEAREIVKPFGDDAQLLTFAERLIKDRDAFEAKARRKPTTVVFRTRA